MSASNLGEGSCISSHTASHIAYYSRLINQLLKDDPELASELPLDPESEVQLFAVSSKGILLIHLINQVKPNHVKNYKVKPKNIYEIIENQNAAIQGTISLGCKVVGITASLLMDEKKPTPTLALIWQILRYYLVSSISFRNHPEMVTLLRQGEDVNEFAEMSPEQRLLRWANHNLSTSEFAPKTVKNFSKDWSDGEAYVHLLSKLNSRIEVEVALKSPRDARFEYIIKAASNLGINTMSAKELALDDEVFHLAFVASLFQSKPKETPPTSYAIDQTDSAKELDKKLQELLEAERNHEERMAHAEREFQRRDSALSEKERELAMARVAMERELQAQKDLMAEELQRQKEIMEKELLAKAMEQAELNIQSRSIKNLTAEASVETSGSSSGSGAESGAATGNPSQKELDEVENLVSHTRKVKEIVDIPNLPIRKLYVTVAEGRCLIQCDIGSQSDPYVVLEHRKPGQKKPVSKFRTKVIKDNQVNPAWYETIEIRNFGMQDTILLRVWDHDFAGKDFMGEATVTRSDIVNGKSKWFKLGPKPNSKQKIHGAISLEFEAFYPDA